MDSQPLPVGTPADAAAARLARSCLIAEQACTLARWVGRPGRTVTAGLVVRRADVTAAGIAVGVPVPDRVRTATDVPAGFSGEYWSEDDPQEPEPFDLTETNRNLASLNSTDDDR